MQSVAVIGAGLAGLGCARRLHEAGVQVVVIDKGRAPGGRACTRRLMVDGRELAFDHGAQFLTVRHPDFRRALAGATLAPWGGPDRLVPVPRMSALPRVLAEGLELRLGVTVRGLLGQPGAWQLQTEQGPTLGPFAAVAVTAPGPRAVTLLEPIPALRARAASAVFEPCHAALALAEGEPPQVTEPEGGALAWVAHDGSKPGREVAGTVVAHTRPEWSASRLHAPAPSLGPTLEGELRSALGLPVRVLDVHRWRYARALGVGGGPAWDPAHAVGVAGDGVGQARLEAAWLSGWELGGQMLERPALGSSSA